VKDSKEELLQEFIKLKLLHQSGCPAHPANEGVFHTNECTCNIHEVRELRERLKALME